MKKTTKNVCLASFLLSTILTFFCVFIFSFTFKNNFSNNNNNLNLTSQKINEPQQIIVSGGSLKLNGFVNETGKDSERWYGFCDLGEITYQCQKSIILSDSLNDDDISINDSGIISWKAFSEVKTLNFKVCYKYTDPVKGEYLGYSPDITLVVHEIMYAEGGSLTLNGNFQKNGHDDNTWSCYYWNEDVINLCEKKLIDAPQGVNISTNGLIWWDDQVPVGSYSFKIVFTYTDKSAKYECSSEYITLNIFHTITISDGSTNLKGVYKTKGMDLNSWNIYFNSQNVTQYSTLTLLNQPKGVSINKDGTIIWDDQIEIGTYYFQIQASYYYPQEITVISPVIELEIKLDFFVNGGSTKLIGVPNFPGEDNKTWIAIFAKEYTTDVEWSIVGTDCENINISNGIVKWNNDIESAYYSFSVRARYSLNGENYYAYSPTITLEIKNINNNSFNQLIFWSVLGSVLGVVLIICIVNIIVIKKRKRK